MRRYYVLFFIHVSSREVIFAGVTANPTGAWTTHAARNLFIGHAERLESARALVRDRGSQFVDAFDEAFHTEGLYTGFQVWNRQQRHEELLDVDDVALGHQSNMR